MWQRHKPVKEKSPKVAVAGNRLPEPGALRVKDAISILNEMYSGPPYVIGVKDNPDGLISVSLTLEGQMFKAEGRNKKEAKARVADDALESLKVQGIFQMRERERAYARQQKAQNTKERWNDVQHKQTHHNQSQHRQSTPQEKIPQFKPREKKNPPLPKNAIMVLNDRLMGLTYNLVSESGQLYSKVFTMSVCVNGVLYRGTGQTKQSAKVHAAENALRANGWWTQADEDTKKMLQEEERKKEKNKLKSSFVNFHASGEEPRGRGRGRGGQRGGRGGVGGAGAGRAQWKYGTTSNTTTSQWGQSTARGGRGGQSARGGRGRAASKMTFTNFKSGGMMYDQTKVTDTTSNWSSSAGTATGGATGGLMEDYSAYGDASYGYSSDTYNQYYSDPTNMYTDTYSAASTMASALKQHSGLASYSNADASAYGYGY